MNGIIKKIKSLPDYKTLFNQIFRRKLLPIKDDAIIHTIEEYGLIHFCTTRNAEKIVLNGLKPSNYSMRKSEEGLVWTYLNETDRRDEHFNVLKKQSPRTNINTCVIFKDLTPAQLSLLRIRTFDHAITYPGVLKTSTMIIESMDDKI